MDQQLAELKTKLALLKGEQTDVSADEKPATSAADDLEQVKRVFNAILGLDRVDERKRQEDQTMHVCGACFLLQRKANATCELCGTARWLIPSQARKNAEHDMFIRMAAGYSIQDLRIALTSGWAASPEREQIARLLLSSREAKLHPQHEVNIQTAPEDSPRSVLLEQLL